MSREASSSRFFSRNVVEASENEFESSSTPAFFRPSRTPFNAITDPSQYPKDAQDQESEFDLKWKSESAGAQQHRLHDRRGSLNLANATPRLANRHGKATSEPNSALSTPARSGSRVSFGGLPYAPGRGHQLTGGKSGLNSSSSSRFPRGLLMNDNSDASVQVPHFELVEDSSFWADRNVQVLIRIRPLSSTERVSQGYSRCVRQESAQTLVWLGNPETRFTFDQIASETISQEKLFRVAGLPMVENCVSGYNSCMFACGQTGSGKTYTMMGQIYPLEGQLSVDCGITPRIFEYLFQRIRMEEQSRRDEKLRFSCKCSFLEIYNEQITDLLEPSSTNLQLREDMEKGVYVENLTECNVQTVDDVLKLLLQGAANRKIAATHMNSESSRSHSVFTCIIESQWEKDSMTHFRFARLNLVDLAGSERQKSSGAEGDRLKEAANINKSLSTLGLVIMSLVDMAQGKHRHVPYRDSRLTFLLQDSLGGNSKTTIIANVSPSICAANETLSTLKFAQRAKLIQNNAKVNEDSSGDVTALHHQIQKLKGQLSLLTKHYHVLSSPKVAPGIDEYATCGNADNNECGLENLADDFEMPCIQNKKMQRMRATLLGALRREKKAENVIHKLEAEIEQMNHLIVQREEDAQCTKMMLRFREEKIKKLESLVTKEISADKVLMAENSVLKEENQKLQAKIDKNPELTRFALENTRLFEQLQLFQGFYEEGERETLLREVEELREQLLEVLEEKNVYANYENQGNDTLMELKDCKNMNSELMREVDELRAELNKYLTSDSATDSLLCGLNDYGQTSTYSSVRSPVHSNSDDEMAFHTPEADVVSEKLKELKMSAVVSEPGDSRKELMDAKLLVRAMEAEQMDLIRELQRLQEENAKHIKLLGEKDKLESKSAENSRAPRTGSQLDKERKGPSKESNDTEVKALQTKLNSLSDDLQNARILNQQYEMDHASHLSCQLQAELVREQVELETSSTIIHLQEEITAIQIELNEKVSNMEEENVKLKDKIATQEKEIKMISMEWERATLDLTGFILDGSRSLKDASRQVEIIASSFSPLNGCIVDQVERVAKVCIDKEEKILALERSLEDAQKMVAEMDLKLYSLKDAVLAFGEYWQPSSNEPAEVVAELCSFLNENIRMAQMPDPRCDFKHNPLPGAENSNFNGLKAVKCISDCNKGVFRNNFERNIALVNPDTSAKLTGRICKTEGKVTTPVEDVTSQLELAKITVLESQSTINACYADIETIFSTLQNCTLEPSLAYRELVQDFGSEICEMRIKFLELKENCNDFGFNVNKLLSLGAFNTMRCQMLHQIEEKLEVTNSSLNTLRDLIRIHFEDQTEKDRWSVVSSSSSSVFSNDSYASQDNLSGSCCSRKVTVSEEMVDINYQEGSPVENDLDNQFLQRRVLDEGGTNCLRKELKKAFDSFSILYLELNDLLVKKNAQDCSYREEMKQVIPSVGLTADNLVMDEAGSCNRGVLGHNKVSHAKSFFQRFEEVHATVEEADFMLNTLLNENESTNALNSSWRRANEELLVEKASLIEEVEHLRDLIHLKERENMALCDQLHETLVDVDSSISLLEGCFLKMQKEVDEKFENLRTGVLSFSKELLSIFPDLGKSLEDTCALVLENDFTQFATYQCQVGDAAHGSSIFNVVGGSHSSRKQERRSTIKYFQKNHAIGKEDGVACSVEGIEESGSEKLKRSKDQIDLALNWLKNENCSLKKELERKEVLLEGLLFDLHLLQESATEMKDFKDEIERLTLALRQTRHELDEKTKQIDDLLLQQKKRESNLVDAENALSASTSNLEQAKEEIDSLLEQNAEMRVLLKELYIEKTEAQEQLEEQGEVIKGLEKEVLWTPVKNDFPFSVEGSDDFRKIVSERDNLQEEICSLNHKLEMALALADEKEAIAVESLQMSEGSKLYAEQKEEEVKILEHSVEELERTVNMLEKKVYEMDEEVERHRAIRYSLEHELEALCHRLSTVGHFTSALVPYSRNDEQTEDQTSRSLEVQEPSMSILQEERAELRREIKLYKEYISEVVLHSEAQASQYQQKYKVLEAMFQEIKKEASSTSVVASENKVDRTSTRTRGSSSPFRCISSLVQQMNLEKDQELSNARLRIEELETLASSRQQEVCMLNTRLAAAESMTHDVIRDLLGVKLDMTNYADIVEQHQMQKLVEEAHQQAEEFLAKEQEILELRKQVHDLIEERESCIIEINKRDAEVLTAKVSVEQLKERDLLLSAQNEMLKKDKTDLLKKVAELDDIIGNTQGTEICQKEVHPTTRIKDVGPPQAGNVDFAKRLQQSEKLLSRVNDELALYHANNGARPHAGASAKGSDVKYRMRKG